MRAGRGALLHDSPTSPQDTTQGGGSIGRGFVRAQRKPCPLPALRVRTPAQPHACPLRLRLQPAPRQRIAPKSPPPPHAATSGTLGHSAGRGQASVSVSAGQAGGMASAAPAQPPAPCFPLPAPHSPTDGGRGAERAPPRHHATLSPTILADSYPHSS